MNPAEQAIDRVTSTVKELWNRRRNYESGGPHYDGYEGGGTDIRLRCERLADHLEFLLTGEMISRMILVITIGRAAQVALGMSFKMTSAETQITDLLPGKVLPTLILERYYICLYIPPHSNIMRSPLLIISEFLTDHRISR